MPPIPGITIVTPSFNQEKYQGATIISIIGQGYHELECIDMCGSIDELMRELNTGAEGSL